MRSDRCSCKLNEDKYSGSNRMGRNHIFVCKKLFFLILSIKVGCVFGESWKVFECHKSAQQSLLKHLTKIDEHFESYRKKKNNGEIYNFWQL